MALDLEALVADPNVVATRLGLQSPSEDQLERIAEAIIDAQTDVENYLNRPIIPTEVTLTELLPRPGFDPDSWQAWPAAADQFDDVFAVKSKTLGTDGLWTVTFTVGLDGRSESAIRRYVTVHTVRTVGEDETYGLPSKRVVNNISAEGQSLTFAPRPSDAKVPGSLPSLDSLKRFRRVAVHRARRAPVSIWPNTGMFYQDNR